MPDSAQPNNAVTTSQSDAEILQEAREWINTVRLYESDIRAESAKCVRFRSGEQWQETILQSRGANRPSIVVDHTGQFIDQVVNDWRKNRVGIKTSPGDESSDTETAQIYDGIIRETEYRSKAHIGRDKAFDQMTGSNRGFTRLFIKRRPGSFRRDIWHGHIPNPDCVYFDPFCVEPDYSDAMRCLVEDQMGKKQYHAEWGKRAAEIDFTALSKTGDYGDWIKHDAIRVAEWWVRTSKDRKIQWLNKQISVIRNGRPLTTDIVYDNEWDPKEPLFAGVDIRLRQDGSLMEDDEPIREVWQYIVNGVQVLDKVKWDGSYIPIIPWYGKELLVNGKKRLYALISRILDAQQALNYSVSASVGAVALTPINPLVGWVGQDKTNQKQIAESNRVPYAFLGFDIVYDKQGNPITTFPKRENTEADIQATSYLSQQLIQFMKAGVGMYGASLGDREGKARSGVAEQALQQEGDNATFDFLDNGARAVELEGCQIVELIPEVYSQPELMQIRDAQNKIIQVAVNQDIRKMPKPPKDQQQNFMLAEGKYNVAVSAAPSHETLRKEGKAEVLEYMKLATNPDDQRKMMLASMRLSGNQLLEQIADAMDPPQGQVDPKMIAGQLQQALKMIELQAGVISDLEEDKKAQASKSESQERIAALKAEVDRYKVQLDAIMKMESMNSNEELARLQVESERTSQAIDMMSASLSQEREIEAGAESQMAEHAHASQSQQVELTAAEKQAEMAAKAKPRAKKNGK